MEVLKVVGLACAGLVALKKATGKAVARKRQYQAEDEIDEGGGGAWVKIPIVSKFFLTRIEYESLDDDLSPEERSHLLAHARERRPHLPI